MPLDCFPSRILSPCRCDITGAAGVLKVSPLPHYFQKIAASCAGVMGRKLFPEDGHIAAESKKVRKLSFSTGTCQIAVLVYAD